MRDLTINPSLPPAVQAPDIVRENVDKAIKIVKGLIDPISPGLEFSVDTETDCTMVKVVDTATKKVLRQFPSEEMLQLAQAIDNMHGLLLRQKA